MDRLPEQADYDKPSKPNCSACAPDPCPPATLGSSPDPCDDIIAAANPADHELRVYLRDAPIGLTWIGSDGIVQWANRAELEMLGFEPAEYVGQHLSQFYTDKARANELLERLANNERLHSFEARLRSKDGSIKTVQIDARAIWEEDRLVRYQSFSRDISEQLVAEYASRRLAAIIESSDDAIVSKTLEGVVMSWNKGAERIFGFTEKEAVGQPITIIIPPELHNQEPEILARIRSGERIEHFETIRKRKDGTLIDISVTISPIRDRNNNIVGASKIARDITALKLDQQQKALLAEELRLAKQELEARVEERTASLGEAVRQMEEFSYTVSHDLRAPLRAMGMYSRVLLEDHGDLLEQSPEATGYVHRIVDSCARLDTMIQDVLTFGRVSREGIQLQPVCLDTLVRDIISHHPSLQAPRATVTAGPLGAVIGHEPSLYQAISNLLTNAVKFAGDKPPAVEISAESRGPIKRLWIRDNGIGIDPEFKHRLFQLFERLHTASHYEGNGVGLAIVKRATERMGGSVGVESDGRTGSSFWIELPEAQLEPAGG